MTPTLAGQRRGRGRLADPILPLSGTACIIRIRPSGIKIKSPQH